MWAGFLFALFLHLADSAQVHAPPRGSWDGGDAQAVDVSQTQGYWVNGDGETVRAEVQPGAHPGIHGRRLDTKEAETNTDRGRRRLN